MAELPGDSEGQAAERGTPPVDFSDELALVEAPSWPKVIGWISISWGALMIFCAGCGTAMSFVGPSLMPPEVAKDMPPTAAGPGQIALAAVGILVDILLICGGAMTLGRKPVGRTLHLLYGVAALPLFVASIMVQMKVQADMKQWAIDNPTSKFAQGMTGPGSQFGQVFGWAMAACLGLTYPVFCLCWFGLARKRPEVGAPEGLGV